MLGTLGGRTAAIASAGFARNLRHNLFSKIQDFSFSNIDRFSSSSLITRMTTDVTNVQNAYQMIIRILVRSPLILVFSLIMVSTISPELMLVYLVVLPILAIGLALVIRFAHPLFLKVFRIYDRLNNVVQEIFKESVCQVLRQRRAAMKNFLTRCQMMSTATLR